MIDLHTHTTFSDGEHSPAELIRLAKKAGVEVLAITDHDTVDGLAQAEAAAFQEGITLVRGIEISAELNGREIHILGHFLPDPSGPLLLFAKQQQQQRFQRALQFVQRLEQLGFPCTIEEIREASNGKNLCRPHIARVLLNRGYVRSIAEAFERFLGVGKPAYIFRNRLPAKEAIAIVRESGGTATLAHARVNQVTPGEIAQLKAEGLVGIEVAHPEHSSETQTELLALADNLELIPTAGTDFHGHSVIPNRALGMVDMHRSNLERLRKIGHQSRQ